MKYRKTVSLLEMMLILATLFLVPFQTFASAANERNPPFNPIAIAYLEPSPAYPLAKKLDRDAIVKYAYKYGGKYNPAYRSFGNDCTNFVSQALYAGGWRNVGPLIPYYTKYTFEWWYLSFTPRDNSGQSRSWTEADSFFQYANVSGRATFTLNLSLLEPGDVVQVDWERDFHIDHTMIVTKKDRNGIYLTYHSGDGGKPVVDKPLSEIQKKYPKAMFYGFRLNTYL